MQIPLPIDNTSKKLATIHNTLLDHYGTLPPSWHPEPVWQLIFALVGKKTNGRKSNAASMQLMRNFATPRHVMNAPVEEIRGAIFNVVRPDEKANEIKTALTQIVERRGVLSLDFLTDWPEEDAMLWLEQLHGVARKTAAAVINFSTLRKRALVLDTHNLRVLARLGLIRSKDNAKQAYPKIVPYLPEHWTADDFDTHHWLVKRLGQQVCEATVRRCPKCPIKDWCQTSLEVCNGVAGGESGHP